MLTEQVLCRQMYHKEGLASFWRYVLLQLKAKIWSKIGAPCLSRPQLQNDVCWEE